MSDWKFHDDDGNELELVEATRAEFSAYEDEARRLADTEYNADRDAEAVKKLIEAQVRSERALAAAMWSRECAKYKAEIEGLKDHLFFWKVLLAFTVLGLLAHHM